MGDHIMSMNYITVNKADGVFEITHENPPMNFLNVDSMKQFIDALNEAETDPDVKVVAIRGGKKLFSAGVDVGDHEEEKAKEMGHVFHELLHQVMNGTKPTVAVVEGSAIGGGCELIAFCDMVYASERAMFGQPEINVGVFPSPATSIFPKLIGLKKTLELILTGDMISAAEAEKIGLINQACPPEELENQTAKLLKTLCEKSSVVLQLTKKAIISAKDMDLERALVWTGDIYEGQLMHTEDANIGIEAYLNKTIPVWKNR